MKTRSPNVVDAALKGSQVKRDLDPQDGNDNGGGDVMEMADRPIDREMYLPKIFRNRQHWILKNRRCGWFDKREWEKMETGFTYATIGEISKCKLHHEGQCTAKCHNCKRIGHLARDCRYVVIVPTQGTPGLNQGVITYFECGSQGHYRKDCPKVKNQNRGNKARVPDCKEQGICLGGW
ncbi:putative reverse transcriptase domain-containing protein [Tanacetum coccineum]